MTHYIFWYVLSFLNTGSRCHLPWYKAHSVTIWNGSHQDDPWFQANVCWERLIAKRCAWVYWILSRWHGDCYQPNQWTAATALLVHDALCGEQDEDAVSLLQQVKQMDGIGWMRSHTDTLCFIVTACSISWISESQERKTCLHSKDWCSSRARQGYFDIWIWINMGDDLW